MQAPTLRPLGVGEILDAAFKVYTRNAWPLMKIVAVVIVPIQLVTALIFLSTLDDPDALTGQGEVESGSETWGWIAGNVVGSFLGWVGLTIATGAVVKAIADAYLARHPDWRDSLRFAWSRWRALIWLALLTILLLIPAFVALIVPGIWLSIAWIVAVPALMIEDCRGLDALKRSFRLVRKRWWATFAVILVAFLLAGVIQGLAEGLLGIMLVAGADDSLLLTVLVDGVAATIGSVIVTPFQAAVITIAYFDLRVRKEGFDLELLAERLGGPAPEQAPYAANLPAYGQQEWAPPQAAGEPPPPPPPPPPPGAPAQAPERPSDPDPT